MLSLTAESCELFNIPFYQFAQMKKFCPEDIPAIKADYKLHWDNWKAIIQEVAKQLGTPFAKPHIESWTNGWQVRAHFFAYFKYEFNQNSAAIFFRALKSPSIKSVLGLALLSCRSLTN